MDETAKFPNALFLREESDGRHFYFFAPTEVRHLSVCVCGVECRVHSIVVCLFSLLTVN